MPNLLNGKTVELELVGLDGNAYSLMGAFSHAARRQGFTKEEIDKVLTEAKTGDYDHLVYTLSEHCHTGDEDIIDEDDE